MSWSDIECSTAAYFAEAPDADVRFVCPFSACSHVLEAEDTLAGMLFHCNAKPHKFGLFQRQHLPCLAGCTKGFPDELAGLAHHMKHGYGLKPLTITYPKAGRMWEQQIDVSHIVQCLPIPHLRQQNIVSKSTSDSTCHYSTIRSSADQYPLS